MHLLGIGYDCMHTTHEWKFGIFFFYLKKKIVSKNVVILSILWWHWVRNECNKNACLRVVKYEIDWDIFLCFQHLFLMVSI